MLQAIGQVLGNAVGVAISPVPIIALILMLFSRAAKVNSVAFLVGWLVGLTGIGLVVLAIGVQASDGTESDGGGAVKVVVGLLFLALAVKQWRSRPKAGAEPEMPGWMSAIDDFTAIKALGLGLLLTVPNPKNLGLTVSAAASISADGLDGGSAIGALAVFVVLASLTIIVPVVGYLLLGERAEGPLTTMKDWLTANTHTVMTVLFLVLGAKVLGDGLAVLG